MHDLSLDELRANRIPGQQKRTSTGTRTRCESSRGSFEFQDYVSWEALMLPLHHRCLQNRPRGSLLILGFMSPALALWQAGPIHASHASSMTGVLYRMCDNAITTGQLHELKMPLADTWSTCHISREIQKRAVEVHFNCSFYISKRLN